MKIWYNPFSGLRFGLRDLCRPFSFFLKSLMFTKASVMQKYYIKAIQHQNEFPNEIWHFESQ